MENRFNSRFYNNVLTSHLLFHKYLANTLPQDNAPPHKSAETSTWFLENCGEVFDNWPQTSHVPIFQNFFQVDKQLADSD